MNRFGALRGLSGRKSAKAAARDEQPADSLGHVGQLVDEVVRAADRAADEARTQAEALGEGRASVIDRERLAAELMKSLVERTESLRSQANELARVLERAAPLVAEAIAASAQPSQPQVQPAAPPAPGAPPAASPPAAQPGPAQGSSGSVPGPGPAHGVSKPPPSAPSAAAVAPLAVATAPAPEAPVVTEVPAMPEPTDVELETEPFFADEAPSEESFEAAAAAEPGYAVNPEPSGFSRPEPPPPSEGIRLLATQMAVAGSTHAEIEQRLRSEFGVSAADEILAEVFGGEVNGR